MVMSDKSGFQTNSLVTNGIQNLQMKKSIFSTDSDLTEFTSTGSTMAANLFFSSTTKYM